MYDIEDCILKESGESNMSDRAVRLFFFLVCDDSNSMKEYLVAISSLDIDMDKNFKKKKGKKWTERLCDIARVKNFVECVLGRVRLVI